jgi:hypothetical protein
MNLLTQLLEDMIQGNMFSSRDFSAREIANRVIDSDPDSGHLFEIAHFELGVMQMIRDYLCHYFKKDVPIQITSGYRPVAYNKLVGGVENSYHIWRLGTPNKLGLQMISAIDFRPLGVDIEEAFKALSWLKGEFYWNKQKSILHYSPYKEEAHFIKE